MPNGTKALLGLAVIPIALIVFSLARPSEPAGAPGAWSTAASTGLKRQEVSYVALGGKLYLAGGHTRHQVYDPGTNSWSDVSPLPEKLDHIQGVALNGKIYYVGGLEGWPKPASADVYIYDPATDSFAKGAPMPRPRGAGGVAVYNDRIYYAGGLHNGSAVSWFDVYIPATNTWRQLQNMPRSRDHFHAVVVGDRFYAIGGRNTDVNATRTANDAYNFATRKWETGRAPLPTRRGGFAAAAVGDEVLIIGGEGHGRTYGEVEAYNTVTNKWRTLAPMPTPRHGIQAAEYDGALYIAAGGAKQYGSNPVAVHEIFSLSGL